MLHDQRGFSLIELLIVVAIILVLAAIAVPNFLKSRVAANQAAAIESMRVISTAEATYSFDVWRDFLALAPGTRPTRCWPIDVFNRGRLRGDQVLASGTKSGYSFSYTPSAYNAPTNSWNAYTLLASPATYGQTGGVYYYSDQSFVIRSNTSTTAAASDIPVGN